MRGHSSTGRGAAYSKPGCYKGGPGISGSLNLGGKVKHAPALGPTKAQAKAEKGGKK